MKEVQYDATKQIYTGADRSDLKPVGEWYIYQWSDKEVRYQWGHILLMEEEVQRYGNSGAAAAEGIGGWEPEVEAVGGRSEFR